MSDLLDQAKRNAEKPAADYTFGTKEDKPGTGYEGQVIEVFAKESQYSGDMETHVVLRGDTGKTVLVWGSRSVLRAEFKKVDIKVGDRLAVFYKGTEPIKNGKYKGSLAHIYSVAHVAAGRDGSAPAPGDDSAADPVPF